MNAGSDTLFWDSAEAYVERADGTIDMPGFRLDLSGLSRANFGTGGFFTVECYGPDGALKWRDDLKNTVTALALNNVLDVFLRNQPQTATWYMGLVDNAGWSAFASGDTMGSHAGWSESTVYSNASRPTWVPGAAASQSITNPTTTDFNVNASATLKGLFIASDSTKGGTTGTLFATAAFSGGTQAVNNGDTLKATYTCNATAS
jgi:hypothetical protein